MSPSPDHDPVRRERFVALVTLVGDPLARYLGRRASPEDAHDVWADALLVVWRRLDDVPVGAELPWCYGVARRCLANRRRSGVRHLALVRRVGAQRAPVAGLDGRPSDAASVDAPDDPELLDALGTLSDADQELLRLSAWEALGAGEIATVLDITPNAASIRLHRAHGRLRRALEERKDAAPAEHRSGGHARGATT